MHHAASQAAHQQARKKFEEEGTEITRLTQDAVEITHEDLSPNVVPGLSRDTIDQDDDPGPESSDESRFWLRESALEALRARPTRGLGSLRWVFGEDSRIRSSPQPPGR